LSDYYDHCLNVSIKLNAQITIEFIKTRVNFQERNKVFEVPNIYEGFCKRSKIFLRPRSVNNLVFSRSRRVGRNGCKYTKHTQQV